MHSDAPSPATREMSQRASAPVGRTLSMSLNSFGLWGLRVYGFGVSAVFIEAPGAT